MSTGSIPPFDPYVLPFSTRAPGPWRTKAAASQPTADDAARIVREQDRRMHEAQQQALTFEKALQDGRAAIAGDRLRTADDLLKAYLVIAAIAAGRNDAGAVRYIAERAGAFLSTVPDDVAEARAAAEDTAAPDTALTALGRTVNSLASQVRALATMAERAAESRDAGRSLRDLADAAEGQLAAADPPPDHAENGVDLKV